MEAKIMEIIRKLFSMNIYKDKDKRLMVIGTIEDKTYCLNEDGTYEFLFTEDILKLNLLGNAHLEPHLLDGFVKTTNN